MERRSIEVPPGHAGEAVARILHDGLGVAHSTAKGLIDAGCVKINGRPVQKYGQRCDGGDVLEVAFDPARRYLPLPEPRHGQGFRVVHEDHEIVVVDKAPGVLSSPAPGQGEDSLAERIAGSLRDRGIRRPQLFVVHRLDRHTSGLLVFAKTQRALESLTAQFESHEAGRTYAALALGRVPKDRGTILSWLSEDPRSLSVRTTQIRGAGKRAVTHFEVIERFAETSLVRVRLETGRKHQIRVHFAEIAHPILGDRRYGPGSELIARVALHAERLGFRHPRSLEWVSFEAPWPADLDRLVKNLRREGGAAEESSRADGTAARDPHIARGSPLSPDPPMIPGGLTLLDAPAGITDALPRTGSQTDTRARRQHPTGVFVPRGTSGGAARSHSAASKRFDESRSGSSGTAGTRAQQLAHERAIGTRPPRPRRAPSGAPPYRPESRGDSGTERGSSPPRRDRPGTTPPHRPESRGESGTERGSSPPRRDRPGTTVPHRPELRGKSSTERGSSPSRPGGAADRGPARFAREPDKPRSGRADPGWKPGPREPRKDARGQGSRRTEGGVNNPGRGGGKHRARETDPRNETKNRFDAGAAPKAGAPRAPSSDRGNRPGTAARKPWEFKQKGMTLRRERRRKIAAARGKPRKR